MIPAPSTKDVNNLCRRVDCNAEKSHNLGDYPLFEAITPIDRLLLATGGSPRGTYSFQWSMRSLASLTCGRVTEFGRDVTHALFYHDAICEKKSDTSRRGHFRFSCVLVKERTMEKKPGKIKMTAICVYDHVQSWSFCTYLSRASGHVIPSISVPRRQNHVASNTTSSILLQAVATEFRTTRGTRPPLPLDHLRSVAVSRKL